MYPASGVFNNLAYVHRREFVLIADCEFLHADARIRNENKKN